MVCVVSPVDQTTTRTGPASSVTGVPAQVAVGPVMLTTGAGVIGKVLRRIRCSRCRR